MRWQFLLPGLLFLLITPGIAVAQSAGGYGDYTLSENWSRIVFGERAALASSWDRTGGDFDYNNYESPSGPILGNKRVVAATLHGPGIIYRFWMPHITATQRFAVRMFFDGESTPRIDSDSQQILGGTYSYFASPLVNTFAGGQVCYEPIPFRDSLRIETQNKSGKSHWYQYGARLFSPGTAVTSYTGTLDAAAQSARLATVAMFQNAGQHPAGESMTAQHDGVGATYVPASASVTVADLKGPGLIRRLNVRMDAATDADVDSINLRIFYDGDSEPSVDSPVGWFFGAGHGRALYKSLPMGTDSPNGFYCYWPMPFHGAVRVELFNSSVLPIYVDAASVEHEAQPIATDAGYLHAAAKSTTRQPGEVWNTLATATGSGNYIGNLLYVQQDTTSQYFMEGDDLVVVDAADSLHGTGLEDAYNGGHFYNWSSPVASEPEGPTPAFAIRPLHGILRVEYTASPPFARADQYRWRIGDRVPFSKSLEVSMETKYASVGSQWTSVVFWYQLPAFTAAAPAVADARVRHLDLRPIEPNPVIETAVIRFSLSADANVNLELLDVSGRKVRAIVEGQLAAGSHAIRWIRGSMPSGVYFVRLRAGERVETRKIVLAR